MQQFGRVKMQATTHGAGCNCRHNAPSGTLSTKLDKPTAFRVRKARSGTLRRTRTSSSQLSHAEGAWPAQIAVPPGNFEILAMPLMGLEFLHI